jgi:VanZ family protein
VTARILAWGPVVAYMALIFYASSQPSVPPVVGLLGDKVVHAAAYAVLAGLAVRALTDRFRLPVSVGAALLAAAIAAVYGASDEFHQSFVPTREMDAFDLLADSVGAAIAAVGFRAWSILARRK